MKKSFLITAILAAGAVIATPSIAGVTTDPIEFSIQEEKVQIKPDDLPTPVKTAITQDESLKTATVTGAWKITKSDGSVHFMVSFDKGQGEKMDQTYDAEGKKIKE
ncbi:hypothetical protein D0X99_18645 [Algoriphagus lacus]|uniref:PepSY domain-containing protein n=1 Tax=Algoriphagus lacus TaxID=2056311 RepID=A0A418PMA6_9BACT|nr:hypothetical protein [Algoriphagus lacus]RIW12535.1 hypothetical protein D0X99_18645 [Algoriphagus lacus]